MNLVKKFAEVLISIFFKIIFSFVKKRKDKKLEKTIKLYKGEGFTEVFTKIRAWDAPFSEIDKLVPKNAKIVDLGSGDGLLANYLAIDEPKRKVLGIELNKKRVEVSPKNLKNTIFQEGSILTKKLPASDVFILAHVLHHLPSKKDQQSLIKKISRLLKKRKKLVILEIDKEPFIKYLFTWMTDAIIVPILFENILFTSNFYYRPRMEWKKLLTKNGFKVKMKLVNRGMPFSHVLIEAIKK